MKIKSILGVGSLNKQRKVLGKFVPDRFPGKEFMLTLRYDSPHNLFLRNFHNCSYPEDKRLWLGGIDLCSFLSFIHKHLLITV